jgi:hypothetical protein
MLPLPQAATHTCTLSAVEPARFAIEGLHAAVLRAVGDKELQPGMREAAVFLLTSRWLGQNVDRLARVTGLSYAQAARYARRLYDNGIWHAGSLVRSWNDEISPADAFWADVCVAQGVAHRRTVEGGLLEWAPVGSWWKAFELAPGRESVPEANAYQARIESEPAPLWDNMAGQDDPGDLVGEAPEVVADTRLASTAAQEHSPEIFPQAAWLR